MIQRHSPRRAPNRYHRRLAQAPLQICRQRPALGRSYAWQATAAKTPRKICANLRNRWTKRRKREGCPGALNSLRDKRLVICAGLRARKCRLETSIRMHLRLFAFFAHLSSTLRSCGDDECDSRTKQYPFLQSQLREHSHGRYRTVDLGQQ